jgi:hypothetical protein
MKQGAGPASRRPRSEPQRRRETFDERGVAEGLWGQGENLEAYTNGRGSHEIPEERAGAVEARKQHDAAHDRI